MKTEIMYPSSVEKDVIKEPKEPAVELSGGMANGSIVPASATMENTKCLG